MKQNNACSDQWLHIIRARGIHECGEQIYRFSIRRIPRIIGAWFFHIMAVR